MSSYETTSYIQIPLSTVKESAENIIKKIDDLRDKASSKAIAEWLPVYNTPPKPVKFMWWTLKPKKAHKIWEAQELADYLEEQRKTGNGLLYTRGCLLYAQAGELHMAQYNRCTMLLACATAKLGLFDDDDKKMLVSVEDLGWLGVNGKN